MLELASFQRARCWTGSKQLPALRAAAHTGARTHARTRTRAPSPRSKFACRAGRFSVVTCQGLFSSSNYKCFKYASHAHARTHALTFTQPGRDVPNPCFHTLSSVKHRAASGSDPCLGLIRSSCRSDMSGILTFPCRYRL